MGSNISRHKYWISNTAHPVFGEVSFTQAPNATSPNICVRSPLSSNEKSEDSRAYWENLRVYDRESELVSVPFEIDTNDNNDDVPSGVLELMFENYTFTFENYVADSTQRNPFIYEIVLLTVIGSIAAALQMLKRAGYKHLFVCRYTIMLKPSGTWILAPPLSSKRTLAVLNKERITAARDSTDSDKRRASLAYLLAPEVFKGTMPADDVSDVYSLGMTILDAISPVRETRQPLETDSIFEKLRVISPYYSSSFVYILTRMVQNERESRFTLEELVSSLERLQLN